jgi:hypothetical protein
MEPTQRLPATGEAGGMANAPWDLMVR